MDLKKKQKKLTVQSFCKENKNKYTKSNKICVWVGEQIIHEYVLNNYEWRWHYYLSAKFHLSFICVYSFVHVMHSVVTRIYLTVTRLLERGRKQKQNNQYNFSRFNDGVCLNVDVFLGFYPSSHIWFVPLKRPIEHTVLYGVEIKSTPSSEQIVIISLWLKKAVSLVIFTCTTCYLSFSNTTQ